MEEGGRFERILTYSLGNSPSAKQQRSEVFPHAPVQSRRMRGRSTRGIIPRNSTQDQGSVVDRGVDRNVGKIENELDTHNVITSRGVNPGCETMGNGQMAQSV